MANPSVAASKGPPPTRLCPMAVQIRCRSKSLQGSLAYGKTNALNSAATPPVNARVATANTAGPWPPVCLSRGSPPAKRRGCGSYTTHTLLPSARRRGDVETSPVHCSAAEQARRPPAIVTVCGRQPCDRVRPHADESSFGRTDFARKLRNDSAGCYEMAAARTDGASVA